MKINHAVVVLVGVVVVVGGSAAGVVKDIRTSRVGVIRIKEGAVLDD